MSLAIDIAELPALGTPAYNAPETTDAGQACVIAVCDRLPTDDPFAPLQEVLSLQTPADAVIANSALLRTFIGQLNNLIGGSLTQRRLDSMAPKSLHGAQPPP